MLELLERQTSLTINQWKIFTACLFSIVIDFFDFALIGFVLAFFVKGLASDLWAIRDDLVRLRHCGDTGRDFLWLARR